MFYKEEINWKFYVYSDNSKWKFWPFDSIFVKNNFFWDFPNEAKELVEDYMTYRYSMWIRLWYVYIMDEDEMINIIKL